MEVTIEKTDGSPFSEKEARQLIRYIREHFVPQPSTPGTVSCLKGSKTPHEVEIMLDEDSSNVYAAAMCPGVSADRIEVSVCGSELSIKTKPCKTEDSANRERPFLWKCIRDLSYAGKCELPADVIAENAAAELADGILFVSLPKTEAVKPKNITVK